jgi:hypothetical protein
MSCHAPPPPFVGLACRSGGRGGLASLQLLLWPQVTPSAGRALLAALAWGSWSALWLGLGGFALWELVVLVARLFGWRPRWPRLSTAMAVAGVFVAVVAFFNQEATREVLPAAHRQALGVVAALGIIWAAAWLATRRWRSSWLPAALFAVWATGVWWPWWGAQQAAVEPELAQPAQGFPGSWGQNPGGPWWWCGKGRMCPGFSPSWTGA